MVSLGGIPPDVRKAAEGCPGALFCAATGPPGSGAWRRRHVLRTGGVRSAPAWWAPANRPPRRAQAIRWRSSAECAAPVADLVA